MKSILFIVGSTRRNSFNRQLAAFAERLLEGRAQVGYLAFDRLPFFNQDTEFPPPQAVTFAREMVGQADGLWFFTPEYNASYPGYLKNLVDWLPRPLLHFIPLCYTAPHGKPQHFFEHFSLGSPLLPVRGSRL